MHFTLAFVTAALVTLTVAVPAFPLLDLQSTPALIKSPQCAAPTVSFCQVVLLPVKVARITTLPHPAHPRARSSAARTLLSVSQLHVLLPALHTRKRIVLQFCHYGRSEIARPLW
ncbi:hypothetical protein BDP27DRAFT_1399965, partial [Rhodocollybia butyracea]